MANAWSDGLLLTLLGMGTVFFFLSMLILCMSLMSKCVQRFASPTPSDSDTIAAVVAAAAYSAHHTSR